MDSGLAYTPGWCDYSMYGSALFVERVAKPFCVFVFVCLASSIVASCCCGQGVGCDVRCGGRCSCSFFPDAACGVAVGGVGILAAVGAVCANLALGARQD